ncbi:NADH-quinone oxidoreductase subunit NuoG [Candidatus Kinetoplastidibacterium crithidiae]|nr:NADH-quinone oxidoreductase subunit NuoG [Candidatus Kinetoplastibacterium crithidii]
MIEITVNGEKIRVPKGSNLIQVTEKLGCYVPHFCYHKKLSVAANCRMCLVEIEKTPKLMPACSTIASEGMVIYTDSKKVKEAQNSVMEFLLINHPLDCPVCDQGGECQLQDLAVGYGKKKSRYSEKEKRVVFHKNFGPLISAEEMSRCIHCTRCIRFGQEIAGIKELGMLGRGENSEISTFLGNYVESELSGNMIDICPVGALTSKPFRFKARTWELARRKSISPHDSLGTNLIMQIKNNQVMRVVPFENDDVNECWITDRDRFSYEGLNSTDRLSSPMFKDDNGDWKELSWEEALEKIAYNFNLIKNKYGEQQIAGIASEYSTLEEFYLFKKLLNNIGSNNVDFRLRQNDSNLDKVFNGIPWLGCSLEELEKLDILLVVGSDLRNDHPLIAHRLRKAVKRGAKIFILDSYQSNQFINISGRITVIPSQLHLLLAELCVILSKNMSQDIPREFEKLCLTDNKVLFAIAQELLDRNKRSAILLGNMALSVPNASKLVANAGYVADIIDSNIAFLGNGANAIGGYVSNFLPEKGKLVNDIFNSSLKSYIVLHSDPYLDIDNGANALKAINSSEFSVALTPYFSFAKKWANIILPISPFSETSGTYINSQGIVQSFKGVVAPFGKTRPAWKVFCALGKLLNISGFNYESSDEVKQVVLTNCDLKTSLSNSIDLSFIGIDNLSSKFERIPNVPIYRSDVIVRSSTSLQKTKYSQPPVLRLNSCSLKQLGISNGEMVKISSSSDSIKLAVMHDDFVPNQGLYLPAAFEETASLGCSFEDINVEKL